MESSNDMIMFEDPVNKFEPIDFMIFKEEIKEDFISIISKTNKEIEGEVKALVLSKYLASRFSYIIKYSELVKLNFSQKIYYLENCPQDIKENQILFIIPPRHECIDLAADQINKDQKDLAQKQKNVKKGVEIKEKNYIFYYVPKVEGFILDYISREITLYRAYFDSRYDFELNSFPLDYDIISLESNPSFKEIFMYKLSDSFDVLSNLIIKIEELYGRIKYRYTLGDQASLLNKNILKKEEEGYLSPKNPNEIYGAIFIDRTVDFITPLVTEFTYEGLIHSKFDISFNKIKVSTQICPLDIKDNKEMPPTRPIYLGMEDKLYYNTKNYNFNKLRNFLPQRLKYEQELIKKGKENRDFNQISHDIKMIKCVSEERSSLVNHINLANYLSKQLDHPKSKQRLRYEQRLLDLDKDVLEQVHEYYESEMGIKGDPYDLLRLFCLENLVFGGVKNKIYDTFKNDFILTYENSLFLLKNLEDLKILKKGGSSKTYQTYKEKLNLINEKVNVMNPNDSSYVCNGFCPITIRLIESIISTGLKNINKDLIKALNFNFETPEDEQSFLNPTYTNNFILLIYIGGITYSELAAIRYLNSKPSNYKFLVITTNIINYTKFFDSIKSNDIELAIGQQETIDQAKEKADLKYQKELEERKEKERQEREAQKKKFRDEYRKEKEKELKKKK